MRKEQIFNFEKLSAGESKLTIQDCQDYFDYAKIQFELQKYKCKLKVRLNDVCRGGNVPFQPQRDIIRAVDLPLPTCLLSLLGASGL